MEKGEDELFDIPESKLHQAFLNKASRVVVFSGAGISAESGIATFRAPKIGVWASKVGLAYFGTPFGWWLTPSLAWGTYLKMFRDPIAAAQPNPGHYAVTKLQTLCDIKGKTFDIVTQNVDGLHQRAGSDSHRVYELHGTVWRHKCSKKGHVQHYEIDPTSIHEGEYDPTEDEYFTHNSSKYPRCDYEGCNSYLRPDAVLFTEGLPGDAWVSAEAAVSQLDKDDVMIIVGTSGVVYPAASLAEGVIATKGVRVVEINPTPSNFTGGVSVFLQGTSGKVLPVVVEMFEAALEE